jgi:formylglycine-generating enzyme required for sulfatase activity
VTPFDMVSVPAGTYLPAFALQGTRRGAPPAKIAPRPVKPFRMDRFAVTNAQFLAFVAAHPQWRRSQIKALFADRHYLEGWRSDLSWGPQQTGGQPVTSVSWFAAEAYCEARGGTLPTTDQWEYALWDRGRNQEGVKAAQLAWFAVPNTRPLPEAAKTAANGFGIHGLAGVTWELTLDPESAPAGGDSRGGADRAEYCGAGSVGARDATDYAAFMRYSFRSCIKASFTTRDLGFRCAMSAP